MISALANSFKIPDLRKKLFFTAMMIAIYRLGCNLVIPGVDAVAVKSVFSANTGGWLNIVNMFSGGAFRKLSIFALGIMPYISSSIILQLLTAVVPYLNKLSKEGEAGRKKITQYTRYGTILLSIIQSSGLCMWISGLRGSGGELIVVNPGMNFKLMTVLTMTTGTTFIMWLGEQITERGIGNGISIIIYSGIVANIPRAISEVIIHFFKTESLTLFELLFIMVMVLFVVAVVIIIQLGHRRIPINYAKQVRGRKVFGGQSTHLPLKVDYSGVIAVIFASSILMFPNTIMRFVSTGENNILNNIAEIFNPSTRYNLFTLFKLIIKDLPETVPLTLLKVLNVYNLIFGSLVIFFCYFYTAIVFSPKDVADNLKKSGGFIPGRRPGYSTEQYINGILTRITLAGALLVVFICIFPSFVAELLGGNLPSTLRYLMGGTTVLILVGVDLDTIQQMESHLIQRHYTGFMKQGRLRSRRGSRG